MSGFCGILRYEGASLTTDDLGPMMAEITHRGRDGYGVWIDRMIAMGHQMTHTTPESLREQQPVYLPGIDLSITGDIRIDNREELLRKLGVDRPLWSSTSDSHLALLAYERWGVSCATRLIGDFAFALWDARVRCLFCARDFIGVKPFYYLNSANEFRFASDICALAPKASGINPLSPQLDLRYVRSQLEWGPSFNHLHKTFYEGLLKLPPGHWMTVKSTQVHLEAYWQPEQVASLNRATDAEVIEQLANLLREAVDVRLRAAFSVGSHLSGGLDSTAVTVLAARNLRVTGRSLQAFNWAPPPEPGWRAPIYTPASIQPVTDERALVEAVCASEGIVPIYTPIRIEDRLASHLRDITRHPDHTLVFETTAGRLAEESGTRVMLSGWGGDETVAFNGRGYFADLLRRGRWLTMSRELALRSRLHQDDFWGNFRSRAILPLLPTSWVMRYRPRLLGTNRGLPLPVLVLTPDFAAALTAVEPYHRTQMRERPGVRQSQIQLLRHGHLTHRLESWADYGGYRGLEYRFPLLDRRVVEFALGMGEHLFHRNGWKRHAFRLALVDIVPDEVRWNLHKTDPAAVRGSRELADLVSGLVCSRLAARKESIVRAGYLDADRFLEGLASTADPVSRESSSRVLWLATMER